MNYNGTKLVCNDGYDCRSIPKWITQVGFSLSYYLMDKIVNHFPSIEWFQKLNNDSIKLLLVKPNQTKVLKRKKESNGKYLIKLEQTNKWMDRSEIVQWTHYAFAAKIIDYGIFKSFTLLNTTYYLSAS